MLPSQVLAGIRDCPMPPAPSKAVLQTVGDELRINGSDMRVWRLKLNQSPSKVLDFYRGAWTGADGKPFYIEYPLDSWNVIATNKTNCFIRCKFRQRANQVRSLC